MKEYRSLLILVSVIFFIGLSFGILLIYTLSSSQKETLLFQLHQFFLNYQDVNQPREIFWQTSLHYLKWTALIFILGISVIGIPLVILFVFAKGVMVGFTSALFIQTFYGKGFFFILFNVLPQNLLIVPTLILLCTSSLAFSIYLIRNRLLRYKGKLLPYLLNYLMICVALYTIFIISSMYQSYIAPILVQRSIPMILY